MDVLERSASSETPEVRFDPHEGLLSVSGRSLPEDAGKFYDPIIDWISAYCNDPQPNTILNIRLDYFNSSSAKKMVQILTKLEDLHHTANRAVEVNWCYAQGDDLMEERGEELQSIVDIPIHLTMIP